MAVCTFCGQNSTTSVNERIRTGLGSPALITVRVYYICGNNHKWMENV